MANDCLVTKLKGTVDNDSLLKLGEFRTKAITAFASGSYLSLGAGDNNLSVRWLVGSDRNGNTSDTVYAGHDTNETALEAGAVISISSKYDITKVACNGFEIDFGQLEYSPMSAMTQFLFVGGAHLSGDMGKLINGSNASNITTINIQADNRSIIGVSNLENLTGLSTVQFTNVDFTDFDIAKFAGKTSLTSINCYRSSSPINITGNLSSLASCIALNSLQILRGSLTGNVSSLGSLVNCSKFVITETNITGTLESLIDALRTAGRTGQTVFDFSGTYVTYQGELMTAPVTITI